MDPKLKLSEYPLELRYMAGVFPTLDAMIRLKLPLPREVYLRLAWGYIPTDNFLAGEGELELPPPFRNPPDTRGSDCP